MRLNCTLRVFHDLRDALRVINLTRLGTDASGDYGELTSGDRLTGFPEKSNNQVD
jgi:hypothetical protein